MKLSKKFVEETFSFFHKKKWEVLRLDFAGAILKAFLNPRNIGVKDEGEIEGKIRHLSPCQLRSQGHSNQPVIIL